MFKLIYPFPEEKGDKVPKTAQKFRKISENGTLKKFYCPKSLVMIFIFYTNFTLYTMHLVARLHRNKIMWVMVLKNGPSKILAVFLLGPFLNTLTLMSLSQEVKFAKR